MDSLDTLLETPDGANLLLANQNRLDVDAVANQTRWSNEQRNAYLRTRTTPPSDSKMPSPLEHPIPEEDDEDAEDAEDAGNSNESGGGEDDDANEYDIPIVTPSSKKNGTPSKKSPKKKNHASSTKSPSKKDDAGGESENDETLAKMLDQDMRRDRDEMYQQFLKEFRKSQNITLINKITKMNPNADVDTLQGLKTAHLHTILGALTANDGIDQYREKNIKRVTTVLGMADNMLRDTRFNLFDGSEHAVAASLRDEILRADWEKMYYDRQSSRFTVGKVNIAWAMGESLFFNVMANGASVFAPFMKKWCGKEDVPSSKFNPHTASEPSAQQQQPSTSSTSGEQPAPSSAYDLDDYEYGGLKHDDINEAITKLEKATPSPQPPQQQQQPSQSVQPLRSPTPVVIQRPVAIRASPARFSPQGIGRPSLSPSPARITDSPSGTRAATPGATIM